MRNKKTIFLHIEKTGGISLGSLIEQNYERDQYYKYYNISPPALEEDFRALRPERKRRLKVIIGHYDYGIHEKLDLKGFKYVTVMRSPVSRLFSLYMYIRREPNFWLHEEVKKMTLKEFLGSGIYKQADNGMTRRIAGATGEPFGQLTHDHLETAKANLKKKFALVGLINKFDETLVMMKQLGIFDHIGLAEGNATFSGKNKASLTEEDYREISLRNVWDNALYVYAMELFGNKLCRQGDDFFQEVADFKNKNVGRRELFTKYAEGLQQLHDGCLNLSWAAFKESLKMRNKLQAFPQVLAKNLYYLGDINRRLGKEDWRSFHKDSLEVLQQKQRKSWEDIYLVASLHKKLGEPEKAEVLFRQLVREANAPYLKPGAYFHLGELRMQSGEREVAREMFEKTLQYNPLHRKAKEYLD